MRSGRTASCLASYSHCHEVDRMTDPTGRCFLSYRRIRKDEAAVLIMAQHDHGIPTWQDVRDLGSVPTEDEIRSVLEDPNTASAVLLITPEVADSVIMRNVEIPKIIKRSEARDGFFVVPVIAGGLDYADAGKVANSQLSAQNLADWNLEKVPNAVLSPSHAAQIARRVLTQRLQAIHSCHSPEMPLQVGFFVRRAPALEPGIALRLDWSERFAGKEATQNVWEQQLLPALAHVAETIRRHAPGREVHAHGLPTLPAALAFGCQFLVTSGLRASWRQIMPGQSSQLWGIEAERVPTDFVARIFSKTTSSSDVAVLVSVTDTVEPLFAESQSSLPPLRAIAHVSATGGYPYTIESAGEAVDIAMRVQEAMRELRRQYGRIGTVHLFAAVPAGLAMLIGQLLNTFSSVQTYEHVATDEASAYRPAALLRPSA